MKPNLLLLPALCLGQYALAAEPQVKQPVTVVAPPAQRVVVERVTTTSTVPLEHLAAPPKAIPVEPAPAVTTTRTVTTTTVPLRVYQPDRQVVVVERKELPYVTIPVLFEKETDNLLDAESREALTSIANVIREIAKNDPVARFDIEGHTSAEGTQDFNMDLSAKRARKVYQELTQTYGVAATLLTAHGYGENYPAYPKGSEEERQKDRRVLVVRTQ